jgi:hypothetical protein
MAAHPTKPSYAHVNAFPVDSGAYPSYNYMKVASADSDLDMAEQKAYDLVSPVSFLTVTA